MRAILAATALCGAQMAGAQDRLVDTGSARSVAALLPQAGYKADIRQGKDYIVSAANGQSFQILFSDCKTGACGSYRFFSYWKKAPYFSDALANEWNRDHRFPKVAIESDGDLSEFADVSAVGKQTYADFVDPVEWYASADAELSRFLSAKEKVAGTSAGAATPK